MINTRYYVPKKTGHAAAAGNAEEGQMPPGNAMEVREPASHPLANGPASPGQVSRQKLLARLSALKETAATKPHSTLRTALEAAHNVHYGDRNGNRTTKDSAVTEPHGSLFARRNFSGGIPNSPPGRRRSSVVPSSTAAPFASPVTSSTAKAAAVAFSAQKATPCSFDESCMVLSNLCTNSLPNPSISAQHLQNMQSSHRLLQNELREISDTSAELQLKSGSLRVELDKVQETLAARTEELSQVLQRNEEEQRAWAERSRQFEKELTDLKEQLTTALSTLEKEQSNVEFLQNYMVELISGKDDLEAELMQARKKLSEAAEKTDSLEAELLSERTAKATLADADDLRGENAALKERIGVLEAARDSGAGNDEKAPRADESDSTASVEAMQAELRKLQADLQQKQHEVDKFRGREQHFRESNEIFQQKLVVLSEENRRLRGQRITF